MIPSITVRKVKSRNLWEARATISGRRVSKYGNSSETAHQAMLDYVTALSQIAEDRRQAEEHSAQKEYFSWHLSRQLAPLYSSSKVENTRNQAKWAITILITHFGRHKTRELELHHVTSSWELVKAAYPAPGSQKAIRKYLLVALDIAKESGLIPWNYAEKIKIPKVQKRGYVPAPTDFMALWLHHRDHPLWGPKFFLEGVLGLRDEEANAITADFLTPDSLFVPGTKNDPSERTIYLPPRIAEILAAYAQGGKYLVRNSYGRGVTATQNRDLKRAYTQAEQRYAGNHGLRHFFGQIESAIGCPRSIRKAILGQDTTSDIGDLYVHPSPANVRDWLARWEEFLGLDGAECLPSDWGTAGVHRKEKSSKPV